MLIRYVILQPPKNISHTLFQKNNTPKEAIWVTWLAHVTPTSGYSMAPNSNLTQNSAKTSVNFFGPFIIFSCNHQRDGVNKEKLLLTVVIRVNRIIQQLRDVTPIIVCDHGTVSNGFGEKVGRAIEISVKYKISPKKMRFLSSKLKVSLFVLLFTR